MFNRNDYPGECAKHRKRNRLTLRKLSDALGIELADLKDFESHRQVRAEISAKIIAYLEVEHGKRKEL